jgi:CubicO group peptidase (beta-lactamase class C family)
VIPEKGGRTMKKLVFFLTVLMILSLVIGCGGKGGTAAIESDEYWPTEGWRVSTPAEQDMDSARLDELAQHIDDLGLAIDSVVVVRNGYIVHEEYPNPLYDEDMPHILHSVTKSFVSALVGIAIEQGYIEGIHARIADLFSDRTMDNMNEQKESITLEDYLTMKAGYEWEEWKYPYTDQRNDYIRAIYYSSDPIQYVLDLPMMEDPGVRWNYNGGTTHLLSALITEVTGYDTLDFAREYLFDPLGIKDVSWEHDRHGIYYGGGGLSLKPRDAAKFGYLFLHNGHWGSEQIVPADFVDEATRSHHFFSESRGYGYQSWWTYPVEEVYNAAGLYGQRIYVVPALDLVIVFTASMAETSALEPAMRTMVVGFIMEACD